MTGPNITYREFLNRTEDHSKRMTEASARITIRLWPVLSTPSSLDADAQKVLDGNLSNLYDESP